MPKLKLLSIVAAAFVCGIMFVASGGAGLTPQLQIPPAKAVPVAGMACNQWAFTSIQLSTQCGLDKAHACKIAAPSGTNLSGTLSSVADKAKPCVGIVVPDGWEPISATECQLMVRKCVR